MPLAGDVTPPCETAGMQIGVSDGMFGAAGADPFDLSACADPEADCWADSPVVVPPDLDRLIPRT